MDSLSKDVLRDKIVSHNVDEDDLEIFNNTPDSSDIDAYRKHLRESIKATMVSEQDDEKPALSVYETRTIYIGEYENFARKFIRA